MKRTISILAGFAFFLLANTAQAQESFTDDGLYFSVGGGFSHVDFLGNMWEQEEERPAVDEIWTFKFDLDYALTGVAAVGYVWAPKHSPAGFRAEIEGSYRHAPVGSLTTEVFCTICGHVTNITVEAASGNFVSIGAMLNGYVDFYLGPTVTPYFGAGIGAVRAARTDLVLAGVAMPDDEAYVGAWQVMGGIGLKLSPGSIVGIEYRYFEIQKFRWDSEFLYNDVNFNEILLTFRIVG